MEVTDKLDMLPSSFRGWAQALLQQQQEMHHDRLNFFGDVIYSFYEDYDLYASTDKIGVPIMGIHRIEGDYKDGGAFPKTYLYALYKDKPAEAITQIFELRPMAKPQPLGSAEEDREQEPPKERDWIQDVKLLYESALAIENPDNRAVALRISQRMILYLFSPLATDTSQELPPVNTMSKITPENYHLVDQDKKHSFFALYPATAKFAKALEKFNLVPNATNETIEHAMNLYLVHLEQYADFEEPKGKPQDQRTQILQAIEAMELLLDTPDVVMRNKVKESIASLQTLLDNL